MSSTILILLICSTKTEVVYLRQTEHTHNMKQAFSWMLLKKTLWFPHSKVQIISSHHEVLQMEDKVIKY